MFLFELLVLVALAIISGAVGFSGTPPMVALAGRALAGLFAVLAVSYLIFGAATGFRPLVA